jgi:protein-L-isoaspartate(D-aspartate) O-methyltransferase
MTNFSAQRAHMVQSQLMPSAVTEPRLLAAMAALPRETFVPSERRAVAYADRPIPLANGRMLLDPVTQAKLIQLAGIGAEDRVLIVGCASGYGAAVVARLGREVFAIDEDETLVAAATVNIGATNVTVKQARHAAGLPENAPYQAIIVEGRVPELPEALLGQLAEGGRLVAILGEDGAAKAILFLSSDGTVGAREAFDAPAPALPGFSVRRAAFVF